MSVSINVTIMLHAQIRKDLTNAHAKGRLCLMGQIACAYRGTYGTVRSARMLMNVRPMHIIATITQLAQTLTEISPVSVITDFRGAATNVWMLMSV